MLRALPTVSTRLRRRLSAALGGGHCPLHEDHSRGGCGEECCLEPPPDHLPGGRGRVSRCEVARAWGSGAATSEGCLWPAGRTRCCC